MTKRVLAILICVVMLMVVFSGCSNDVKVDGDTVKPTKTTEDVKKDEKEEPAPVEEKIALNLYKSSNDSGVNPDGVVVNKMEELLGVEINLLNRKDTDGFSALIASGDIPDYIPDGIPVNMVNVWINQGIIASIDEDMFAQHAPKYVEWLKFWLGDDPFVYGRRDGKNYYMPVLWSLGGSVNVMGIRDDWRKNLGLETPKTLAEYEDVLTAFVNNDPDGNGEKDTYGVSSTDYYGISAVWGAFDVYPNCFFEKNNDITFGDIDPAAKDALTVLNRWYSKGLLDPEFMVNKGSNLEEKWVAEKVGSIVSPWFYLIPGDAFWGGKYYEKLLEKNGTVDLAILEPLAGPDGHAGMLQTNPNRGGVVYGKHLEDKPQVLQKYFEYWDYVSFTREGLDLRMKGDKGVTFTYSEDKGYEWLPPYDELEKREEYGVLYSATHFNDYKMQAPYMTKPEYMDIRVEAESKGGGKFDILEQIERPVFAQYKEQLEAFAQKSIIQFITGNRPLDEFDAYVQEWMDMGGAEVMKEAKEKYKEFFK